MSSSTGLLDESNAPSVIFIVLFLIVEYVQRSMPRSTPSTFAGNTDGKQSERSGDSKGDAHFELYGALASSLDLTTAMLARLGFSVVSSSTYSLSSKAAAPAVASPGNDDLEYVSLRVSPNRALVAKIAVAINLPVDLSYSLFDYRVQSVCVDILTHSGIPFERCVALQQPHPHDLRAEASGLDIHSLSHIRRAATGNNISMFGAESAVLRASVAAADWTVLAPPAATVVLCRVFSMWKSDIATTDVSFYIISLLIACFWVIFTIRRWQTRMHSVLAAADARYLDASAASGTGLAAMLREVISRRRIVEGALVFAVGGLAASFIALQDYFTAASFAETEWLSYAPTIIHGGCIPIFSRIISALLEQREHNKDVDVKSNGADNSQSSLQSPDESLWTLRAAQRVDEALASRQWACLLQCCLHFCAPVYLMLMRQDTVLIQVFIYSSLLSDQCLSLLAKDTCSNEEAKGVPPSSPAPNAAQILSNVKLPGSSSVTAQSPDHSSSSLPVSAPTATSSSAASSTPSAKKKSSFLSKPWFGGSPKGQEKDKTATNDSTDQSSVVETPDSSSAPVGATDAGSASPAQSKRVSSIWSGIRGARKAVSRSKSPLSAQTNAAGAAVVDEDDLSMVPLDGTVDLDDISLSDENEDEPAIPVHKEEGSIAGPGKSHAFVPTFMKRKRLTTMLINQFRNQKQSTFDEYCRLIVLRGYILLFASSSPLLCLALCVHGMLDVTRSSWTSKRVEIDGSHRPSLLCQHSMSVPYNRAGEANVIASAVLRDVQWVAGTVRIWTMALQVIGVFAVITIVSALFTTDSPYISVPPGLDWVISSLGDSVSVAAAPRTEDADTSNSVPLVLLASVMLNVVLLLVLLISGFAPNRLPKWAREAQISASVQQMSNSLLSKYYSFAKLSAAGTGAGTGRAARELLRTAQALEKELTCLKLDSLYRLCDKAVDNSTFVVLCTLPFVLQNAIGWKWYFTLPLGLFVNAYYFNRSEKSHETVAKQIVSDRQMFKLVSAEVPNWIGCDAEPCAWVNDMMSQSWSHMAQYGNLKAREAFENMLERQKAGVVKKVAIRNLTIGSEPPRILSLRLFRQSKDKTKIELEVDVRWVSNCSMSLQVGALGTVLTAEVGDLRLSGTCRIILGPLIADVPPFAMLRFAFIKEPRVDFSLRFGESGSIDVLNVEPIAKAMNRLLKRVISSSALYPKWNHVILNKKLVTPSMLNEHLLQPCGIMSLQVLGCNALPIADISTSDPFVEVRFVEDVFRTEIVFRNLNPRWDNESFDLVVYDKELQFVNLSVWDYDRGTLNNDFLGEINVPFKSLSPHSPASMELTLTNCKKADATILVRLTYLPFDIRSGAASSSDIDEDDEIDWNQVSGHGHAVDNAMKGGNPRPTVAVGTPVISGAIIISNITCLRLTEDAKKGDPFLCVDVGAGAKKSKPQMNNSDPNFPETFALIVRDTHNAVLTISVLDARRGHKSAFGSHKPASLGVLRLRLDELFPALLVKSRISETLDAAVHDVDLEGSFGLISFRAKYAPVKQ